MSNSPLVSTIIIFLDEAKFLADAVASVVAQTYEHWELLLVDDGSTDGSTELARRFAEQYPERVRYLEHAHHENRGMSASRNLGISKATGKYLAFLDADDVWLPHKLEQQVAIMELQPEAAMVYGRLRIWHNWTATGEAPHGDSMTELGVPPNTLVKPPMLLTLFLRNESAGPCPSVVLIRREIIDVVGVFENDFRDMYEDFVFYAKIFLVAPVFVADECWGFYRRHADNTWAHAIKAGQWDPLRPNPTRLAFLNWLEKYLSEQNVDDVEVWRALQKELWPYRHPILYSPFKLIDYLVRWMKMAIRQMLPDPVYRWLRTQLVSRGS